MTDHTLKSYHLMNVKQKHFKRRQFNRSILAGGIALAYSSLKLSATDALAQAVALKPPWQPPVIPFDDQYLKIIRLDHDFHRPWSIAPINHQHDMLISERSGTLKRIDNIKQSFAKKNPLKIFKITGIPTPPDLIARSQGGLLEFLPDPDYEHNQTVYFTFAKSLFKGTTLVLARAYLDGERLKQTEIIFEAKPA
ncbi:MAG: PQQ-dependent sugar dehydrogenase, partial [Pseudomonadota bacterium]